VRKVKLQKANLGFTLIELLVVISIIGILASLTLTGFGTAQKNARDTTRKSDLAQYRTTLEAFAANNNGNYTSRTGDVYAKTTLCDDLVAYFGTTSDCPADPKNTGEYRYRYDSDGTGNGNITAATWVLYGRLETGGYWEICSTGKAGHVTVKPDDPTCDF